MALRNLDRSDLSDARLWKLTALAKEARACASCLHNYADAIDSEVERIAGNL
jgi:hypothetical protein